MRGRVVLGCTTCHFIGTMNCIIRVMSSSSLCIVRLLVHFLAGWSIQPCSSKCTGEISKGTKENQTSSFNCQLCLTTICTFENLPSAWCTNILPHMCPAVVYCSVRGNWILKQIIVDNQKAQSWAVDNTTCMFTAAFCFCMAFFG